MTRLVGQAAFSMDGMRVVAADAARDFVRVWDVATGEELLAVEAGCDDVAVSKDGRRLAAVGNDVTVWDVGTKKELLRVPKATSAALSADGARLATSQNQIVTVWDVDSGRARWTFQKDQATVAGLAFSPDGSRLASVGFQAATVYVWDTSPDDGPAADKPGPPKPDGE
jgi:WD40 repeat protein